MSSTPHGDPIVGSIVGDYRIDGRLADGGMSSVYYAHHTSEPRTAAIKVLRASLAGDDGSIRRFRREAEIARAIDDPAVVRVYDAGLLPDGRPYIVMELLTGVSLHALAHGVPLGMATLLDLLEQTARAVAVLHWAGVLHRDLKPSNVHVEGNARDGYRIKLFDFGLARGVARSQRGITTPGSTVGTPGYMSPEQALAMPLDARSDIYSFGCLAYNVLSRRDVYASRDTLDLLADHVRAAIPDVRAARSDVPADLAKLVRRCLAKKPDARPQSMIIVADRILAIRNACGGER